MFSFKVAIESLNENNFPDGSVDKFSAYIRSCVEICWLMRVQDPPVHMRWDFNEDEDFDTNIMRSFTKTGKFVNYVVWPVLYLHENGPLLSKGVVQGKKAKKESPVPNHMDLADGDSKREEKDDTNGVDDTKENDSSKDTEIFVDAQGPPEGGLQSMTDAPGDDKKNESSSSSSSSSRHSSVTEDDTEKGAVNHSLSKTGAPVTQPSADNLGSQSNPCEEIDKNDIFNCHFEDF